MKRAKVSQALFAKVAANKSQVRRLLGKTSLQNDLKCLFFFKLQVRFQVQSHIYMYCDSVADIFCTL